MLTVVPSVVRPSPSDDLEVFAAEVNGAADGTNVVIIDCSELDALSVPAIRILESLSRRATVELTNASPIVCLLATTFGLSVEARREHAMLHTVARDVSMNSDEELLDELRNLAAARDRVNERIELWSRATPRDMRELRRIAIRVDTLVAALQLRRPLRPQSE